MKKETQIVQAGRNPGKQAGSVNTPIYQTSTVIFPTIEDYTSAGKGKLFYSENEGGTAVDFSYGIAGTPTTFALQKALKILEKGDDCVIVPSGLSAITTSLLAFLKANDHLLMVDSVYGPTRRFCTKILSKLGVEITYYDPLIGGAIKKLVKKNTKVIFLESPGSLTFEVQDVPAIVKVAKSAGITTIIDNSWATPMFFNPLELGVDVSIQAITKYIGGHSDLILGAIITKGKAGEEIINAYRNLGITASPHDCWLALRGLRTMAARLERQQKSTAKIVSWIKKRPEVTRVLFPADSHDPGYKLWKKLYKGSASLFSIVLKEKITKKSANKLINSLKLFGIGASWGGYESLVINFDPSTIRTATKWQEKGQCIRFYIGLEDPDDLIKDLENGFSKAF